MIRTNAPARLDRLPWARFHWLVVTALGAAWILDGLEVTLVGSLSAAIADKRALGLSPAEVGMTGSAYVAGAVLGALLFGRLTDSFGRKRLFTLTVGVYLIATIATGLSWSFASFAFCRFLTGAGIGGEYGAVNSAIDELIPARRRGFVDLAINGSFWIGAALGAAGSLVVLDPALFAPSRGWRVAFLIGGALAGVILFIRRFLPESPRWLMTHGRLDEAHRIVTEIEDRVRAEGRAVESVESAAAIHLNPVRVGFRALARVLAGRYRARAVLGLTLMASQAFCYNAVFFTYAMILTRFYGVAAPRVGWYILPFALGNFAGPLLLGPLFDAIGRRVMITGAYGLAGALLALTGWAFAQGLLSATAQTAAWSVIFFFASAAASACYLTVGEAFPLEVRAGAISAFYALGTAIGGIAGPALFGANIAAGSRSRIFLGYLIGAVGMLAAAALEAWLGPDAERKPLEEVAPPLSLVEPPS
ncbi:MAG TPA: MFS transporter [Caulobacteraceae bacterium]|nr:MFS transporter [Caulobacteraceae bacterium]